MSLLTTSVSPLLLGTGAGGTSAEDAGTSTFLDKAGETLCKLILTIGEHTDLANVDESLFEMALLALPLRQTVLIGCSRICALPRPGGGIPEGRLCLITFNSTGVP